ncbi:hypothetical protein KIH31_04390 [Paenarthrobacter sp. DKR-5]|uniref:hypothetical protein n=1 Tax=Paenarthrobacter sp. DKR-5 TaxID=2835535 RepID=UPI001BDCDF63|nr:hypothetical protein [Paenarthrobacter sp. DKR-5]MBT1001834.1 hypothetical protein [Paenarthrobacter sp. DKR-5]
MNLFDMLGGSAPGTAGDAAPARTMCSRKACREAASWKLLWNNPKIHTPERRKTWLACDEHVAWLQDYLQTRNLWRETLPLEEQ